MREKDPAPTFEPDELQAAFEGVILSLMYNTHNYLNKITAADGDY